VRHGAKRPNAMSRDSPDESPTGINVRVFPALLQDRREVLTATSTSGNQNAGRGSDRAIFPGIWTHSFCRLLLNDTERLTLALVVAAAVAPR
jgi:hypothetical protein